MRRNDQINLLALLGAAAFGTIVGIGVGLLIAPKSGEDLRSDIANTGKNLYGKVKRTGEEYMDDFEDFAYDFEDFADDVKDNFEG